MCICKKCKTAFGYFLAKMGVDFENNLIINLANPKYRFDCEFCQNRLCGSDTRAGLASENPQKQFPFFNSPQNKYFQNKNKNLVL